MQEIRQIRAIRWHFLAGSPDPGVGTRGGLRDRGASFQLADDMRQAESLPYKHQAKSPL